MYELMLGDNKDLLNDLEDNSLDSLVTDPPYLIKFMNKKWDTENSPAGDSEFWKIVLQKLKPGAHGLVFGHSRQHHRVMTALEDAGFEIRDCLMWLYGSGFPKSHNISIAIDKQENGMKHRGKRMNHGTTLNTAGEEDLEYNTTVEEHKAMSSESEKWEGWGTALKPAYEPIILIRKPLEKKLTIAKNVLKHGVGGINIDASRVVSDEDFSKVSPRPIQKLNSLNVGENSESYKKAKEKLQNIGRFPANVMLDEEAGKILDEQAPKTGGGHNPKVKVTGYGKNYGGTQTYEGPGPKMDGFGGASRFFYSPKVSKKERNLGCDGLDGKLRNLTNSGGLENDPKWAPRVSKNHHPTVKPLALMKYLIKLITPPGGKVLDPFMGSGSTGMAAILLDNTFIGMEMDKEYYAIAHERLNWAWEERERCMNAKQK